MEPVIGLQTRQRQTLTPALRQAIGMLPLSQLELLTELRQVTAGNCMIDLLEPEAIEQAAVEGNAQADRNRAASGDADIPPSWQMARGRVSMLADPPDITVHGAHVSRRDHLLGQVALAGFSPHEEALAELIVDSLDDDGYLRDDFADIVSATSTGTVPDCAAIERVRQRMRRDFDPAGIASRSLGECLDAQLAQLPAATPYRDLARTIVTCHLDLLGRHDYRHLIRRLETTADAVVEACRLIRQLDPRPGRHFDDSPVGYVIPDVYVTNADNRWSVRLNEASQPRLELNRHYVPLIQSMTPADAQWARGQLRDARWLIKSIAERASIILRVANVIVECQPAFLDYGPEALRPLVLRDVAEQLGVHESTVSRATTGKYMHTPRGNFEFKYFFSTGLATSGGGSASATAIQEMLRKLIASENRFKPLSDQALAGLLGKQGIHIARRTIAKYRETLLIPPSHERKHIRTGTCGKPEDHIS